MKRIMTPGIALLLVCVLSSCATIEQPLFNMGLSFEHYWSGLEYKTVQVDEQTVAYLEREGEGDTVVLLHGFAADKDNWIYFLRHMPEEYRILAIFVAVVGIALGIIPNLGWWVTLSFVFGAICSGLAGFIGMNIARQSLRIFSRGIRILCARRNFKIQQVIPASGHLADRHG